MRLPLVFTSYTYTFAILVVVLASVLSALGGPAQTEAARPHRARSRPRSEWPTKHTNFHEMRSILPSS
ncbi:MAG: hypothetical protein WDM96_16335 [Lacunisphaera sp.]